MTVSLCYRQRQCYGDFIWVNWSLTSGSSAILAFPVTFATFCLYGCDRPSNATEPISQCSLHYARTASDYLLIWPAGDPVIGSWAASPTPLSSTPLRHPIWQTSYPY